jgi:hypothetical protein
MDRGRTGTGTAGRDHHRLSTPRGFLPCGCCVGLLCWRAALVLLAFAALAAVAIPGRRASLLDPSVTLRRE